MKESIWIAIICIIIFIVGFLSGIGLGVESGIESCKRSHEGILEAVDTLRGALPK